MKLSFSPVVVLEDGQFWTTHPTLAGWTHVVLNYIGPNNGEGIRVYYNGTEVYSDTDKSSARIQLEMVGLLLVESTRTLTKATAVCRLMN